MDYSTIDKTAWFIHNMRLGWFSRSEIVDLALKVFPTIPRKTLDGTIGQYWSDSVNPKWGTYKAIQARELSVVENAGKRRIVEAAGAKAVSVLDNQIPTRNITTIQQPSIDGQTLTDPLVNFDWRSLYRRYDASCHRFESQSIHLERVQPAPDKDRTLYYWLVQTAASNVSGVRQGADIGWYEALLYWKLYSQPAARYNIREWLRANAARRRRNAEQLSNLLAELPPTIDEEPSAISSLVKTIDNHKIDGMGSAALPVRTTFLHVLYPTIVPIFDKMVRRAVRLPESDQSMAVFRLYLPHAWALAHRHAENRREFPEAPVRLTDMALWVIRANP